MMTADDIRIYGDPVLRQKAARIEDFGDRLKAFAEEMFEAMLDDDGIGLAAPQVGVSRAFLVIGMPVDEEDGDRPKVVKMAFANPEIVDAQGEIAMEEGCLSLPGIREEVTRAEWIRVKYQDLSGAPMEIVADGLLARVLQHEIDHLNGILIIDRLSPARRSLLKGQLEKLAKKQEKMESPVKELAKTII